MSSNPSTAKKKFAVEYYRARKKEWSCYKGIVAEAAQ
jgi:hypothetical protein